MELKKDTEVKKPKVKKVIPAPICKHPNLVVFEVVSGKRVYEANKCFIDWTSNIVNAHQLKVSKYWCPTCGKIIDAPKDYKE